MFKFPSLNAISLILVPVSIYLLVMLNSKRVIDVMIFLLALYMSLLIFLFMNPSLITQGEFLSLPFRGREVVKGILVLLLILMSLKTWKIWRIDLKVEIRKQTM